MSAGWSWSGGPVTEGQVGAKGFCAADEEEGGQTTVGIKDQSRTRGPWNCPRVPRDKEDVGDLGGRGAARAQAQRGPSGDLRPSRGPAGICQQPGLGQGRRAGHLIQELGRAEQVITQKGSLGVRTQRMPLSAPTSLCPQQGLRPGVGPEPQQGQRQILHLPSHPAAPEGRSCANRLHSKFANTAKPQRAVLDEWE